MGGLTERGVEVLIDAREGTGGEGGLRVWVDGEEAEVLELLDRFSRWKAGPPVAPENTHIRRQGNRAASGGGKEEKGGEVGGTANGSTVDSTRPWAIAEPKRKGKVLKDQETSLDTIS